MTPGLQRTPLWPTHQRLGARLIDFGGWEMPVQYTGIVDEHLAVRSAAGIFDISHMGEFFVAGAHALEFLNANLTNDLRKCDVGRGQYTLMCNEHGGVVDDLYVYQLEPARYLLIVNASRVSADYAWLERRLAEFPLRNDVTLENASANWGAVAVQGPAVGQFVDQCVSGRAIAGTSVSRPTELKKNEIAAFPFANDILWAARTGYTGEDGFELVAKANLIAAVWDTVFKAGAPLGLKPCGLGARDTLRTEMGYPLYGHELDETTTPLEAGLGFFVALDKGAFTGSRVLMEQKQQGVSKRCVAFKLNPGSAPPRPHYAIWDGNGKERIGAVVSGTQSPSLNTGIGLGYVPPAHAKPGTPVQIEIRGRLAAGTVVAKPIYKKSV